MMKKEQTHTHTHLEGAVLQPLHQVVPSLSQILGVRLDLGSCLRAPQQHRHVLSCVRKLVQSPPLLLHVFLKNLQDKHNHQKLH